MPAMPAMPTMTAMATRATRAPLRFTLSVDDGHPLDLRVAALLARHGIPATFYVPVTNCEGAPVMPAAALRELDTQFELASHTAEHRFLAYLDRTAAWRQIRDGKAALEDQLGHAVQGFCYPGGKYRREHVALVRAAGFRYARSTQNLRIDAGPTPFELPTTLQFYPHPCSVLLRNFISQRHWRYRHRALTVALAEDDWLSRLYALLAHACREGSMFHLWLHSADVDALGLWQALDDFLACIARRVDAAQRVCNGALCADSFSDSTPARLSSCPSSHPSSCPSSVPAGDHPARPSD